MCACPYIYICHTPVVFSTSLAVVYHAARAPGDRARVGVGVAGQPAAGVPSLYTARPIPLAGARVWGMHRSRRHTTMATAGGGGGGAVIRLLLLLLLEAIVIMLIAGVAQSSSAARGVTLRVDRRHQVRRASSP